MSQNFEYIDIVFVLIGCTGFAWPGFGNGGPTAVASRARKGWQESFPKEKGEAETMCNELSPVTTSCSPMLLMWRR